MSDNPYAQLDPHMASFALTSADTSDGAPYADQHYSGLLGVPGGEDASPQLSWSGAPAGTKSFAVTIIDPDAPTPSGFWHWGLVDLSGDVTELPARCGVPEAKLPGAAFQLKNDASTVGYVGAAPAVGTGLHHYYTAVHALDVESVRALGVNEQSTLALLHFVMRGHVLARAVIVPTGEPRS
ncbi:YbhB/YbcL family Raf kinase inhibitor-like protein [Streptomyces sp. NPDC054765]